jgi:hypothetical protein
LRFFDRYQHAILRGALMNYALGCGAEIALVCTLDGTVLAEVRRKPEVRLFDSASVATLCGPLGALVGTLNATLGQDTRMRLDGPSLSLRLSLMDNSYVLVALFPGPVHRELGDLCAEQLYERVKQWL